MKWRWALGWFVLSLTVRVVCAWPLLGAPAWPAWDEAGYVGRGLAMRRVLVTWTAGAEPSAADHDAAYGRGAWPPLHSLLIALATWLGGSSLAAARWVPLLASAATTPLVARFAARAAGSGAGLFAASIHLLYPPFLSFAQILWSESLYTLFLVVAAERFVAIAQAAAARSRATWSALGLGLALGGAGLVRAAALPFLVLLPLLVAARVQGRDRLRMPALVVMAMLVVLAPWLTTLRVREGRFVALSTTGGQNLLLGQREGQPAQRRARAATEIWELARAKGIAEDLAGRELAWAELRHDPIGAVRRAFSRLPGLLAVDRHFPRHVLQGIVPPIAPAWALGMGVLWQLSWAALMALLACGFFAGSVARRLRAELALLAVVAMALALVSVATPRMVLPIIALLLPIAGAGAVAVSTKRLARLVVLAALVLGAALGAQGGWLQGPASAHYAPISRFLRVAKLADQIVVWTQPMAACARATVTALPGAAVTASRPAERLSGGEIVTVVTTATAPRIVIECAGARVELAPVDRRFWRVFSATGLPGVELLWLGGSEISPSPFSGNWPVGSELRETAGLPLVGGGPR